MVKHKRKRVVWAEEERTAFRQAIGFIRKQSVQNAENVKNKILASTRSLADDPERLHMPDKYKSDNDGRYRAYEIYRFRITYFVGTDEIRITRFRHTSQQPELY